MTKPVVIVGAGVIGVSAALKLLDSGHQVTLVDRGEPGRGTSFGNASVISEDSVVPVQTPGIVWRVPSMLLDPLGPLAIRWTYLPRLLPWITKFVLASRESRVEEISHALSALSRGAIQSTLDLARLAGAEAMIRRTGWMCVYESEAAFAGYQPFLELQRRRGVHAEVLAPEEIRQREPALAPIFARAIYYPDVAYTVQNFRYVQELFRAAGERGLRFVRGEARDFRMSGERVDEVVLEDGALECGSLVLAAGAWSGPLARRLGSPVPLDTERGYHLTLPRPGVETRLPIYSTERGMACTPLEDGLRIAGTVELGGLRLGPDWRRSEVLYRTASRWFPRLSREGATRWMGYRPSMPDSVPVISRSPHLGNVAFAFGHGHSGLAFAARTAELLSAIVAGRDLGLDMTPYRVDRFKRR